MPRGPAPIRLVADVDSQTGERREYVIRIHTTLEPSGRRRTINRRLAVESADPGTAACVALAHVMGELHSGGRTPMRGTRYQTTIRDGSDGNEWQGLLDYEQGRPEAAARIAARLHSTYRERARTGERPGPGPGAKRPAPSAPDTPAGPKRDPGMKHYLIYVRAQRIERDDAIPVDADGELDAPSALAAAEVAVEAFRNQMPGLIDKRSRRTTYQVDVVREADEQLPYEGWHIEVTYDTKHGVVGRAPTRHSDTVH